MKHVWRQKEKSIYLPKQNPEIIDLPVMKYFTYSGSGFPAGEEFLDAVKSLYSMSYGIRMLHKSDEVPKGYFEYTVYPLEGEWDLNQKGRDLYESGVLPIDLKGYFEFKMMIRQPSFVDEELFNKIAMQKSKDPLIKNVVFEEISEGLSCQMMHIGSYDDEPESFKIMEEFCTENGYIRTEKRHKEIYISDPRRVEVEKMKTTIRFKIKKG